MGWHGFHLDRRVKASRSPERPSGPSLRRKATSLRPALRPSWSTTGSRISTPWSKALREEGCNVLEKIDDSEYGKFAWVIDPEGNKVELWQPPAGQ